MYRETDMKGKDIMEENTERNRDIDSMSEEQVAREILKMELLLEVMQKMEELEAIENLGENESVLDIVKEKHKILPENKPVTFTKPGAVMVDPVMAARRELNSRLHRAIEDEKYEEAARIRDALSMFV